MSKAKRNAARSALSTVPSKGTIGLGSGTTVAYFAEELGSMLRDGSLDISVVPSSYQAFSLAIDYEIPLTNLDQHPVLDLTVDGADEVDKQLNLIKGGGGALLQEKIVAAASRRLIIIVDESKLVPNLATGFLLPIEVLPSSLGFVRRRLSEMGIIPILRMAEKKMGPVVTDNGNFILDLKFSQPILNPGELEIQLNMIPGIIENGLFVGMTDEVHVGTDDGSYVLHTPLE